MGVDPVLFRSVARIAAGAQAISAGPREAELLFARGDVFVMRLGSVVAKAHAASTARSELAARLALLHRPEVAALFAGLLADDAIEVEGRLVTLWTAGRPVDPTDPDAVPWAAAASLLARLHRAAIDSTSHVPMHGGARRLAELVGRIGALDAPAAEDVRRAYASLPPSLREGAPPADATLVHGDFHLGQLVEVAPPVTSPGVEGPWRLIDIDDLGVGDPAWDLARPAAWVAAGVLDPEAFRRFVEAYASAGGPGVDPKNPWARLDIPARALTVQCAAVALSAAAEQARALTEVEEAFVEACPRIAGSSRAQPEIVR